MSVRDVIQAHPQPTSLEREALLRCVTECFDCSAACTSCADANLAEPDLQELVHCTRLCLDCSDVCVATGRLVTRQTTPDFEVLRAAIETCATSCRVAGKECERHATHHEHCRFCAESCRRCEEACNALLAASGWPGRAD
jgi:hypothetical protein